MYEYHVSGVNQHDEGTRNAEITLENLVRRVKVTAHHLCRGLETDLSVGMRHKCVLHQPNAVDRAKMPLDDLGLDPAVRELAERHLTKGDVWRFLRDVGLEVQRFEKEGNELKERESDATERFVTQVSGRIVKNKRLVGEGVLPGRYTIYHVSMGSKAVIGAEVLPTARDGREIRGPLYLTRGEVHGVDR